MSAGPVSGWMARVAGARKTSSRWPSAARPRSSSRHADTETSRMNTLCIVESAYRATLEEQDDTILWLVRAMRGAGAQLSLLLRGNAVNYLTPGHDCSSLSIAGQKLGHPPVLDA